VFFFFFFLQVADLLEFATNSLDNRV